jgi:threonine aldolase
MKNRKRLARRTVPAASCNPIDLDLLAAQVRLRLRFGEHDFVKRQTSTSVYRACESADKSVAARREYVRRDMRSFASDNTAPAAPEILQAIADANDGDEPSYGEDRWSAAATVRFRELFGDGVEVYFTFNGTAANVVALSSLLRPWEAVLAPASAHVHTDECGALERFAGAKIFPIATADGKLRPSDLEPYLHYKGVVHYAQPRIVSISQATEFGGVYEIQELRELCAFAHANGLLVHCDGARLANAAVALGAEPRAMSCDVGIDVLTFGGTKNGLLLGEAVLFLSPQLRAGSAPFVQKQAMQLASKMRYVAAQFDALLAEGRWRRYAAHANAMAQRLQKRLSNVDGLRITRAVRCNAIFATLSRAAITELQREYEFYVFDETLPEVRWMTHWATSERDVDDFATKIRAALDAVG